jgi:hypothetical protein
MTQYCGGHSHGGERRLTAHPLRRYIKAHMRLTLTFLVVCLSAATATAQTSSSAKPNVVLIVTDDVGYGDIGSYGAPDVKTPSIDSLAHDGVRLTDFYAAPQCTPTRAALISGRYQQRFRLEAALSGRKTPGGKTGFPPPGIRCRNS